MNPVSVRQCTISEIQNAPNIDALTEEYVDESHSFELPTPSAQWDQYKNMESIGLLSAISAFIGNELIGFVTVIISVLPHHGKTIAVTESIFVTKAHRKSGAGLALIRAAESLAKEKGSPCLMVSAPHGGLLEKVMPRIGYRHCTSAFVRQL